MTRIRNQKTRCHSERSAREASAGSPPTGGQMRNRDRPEREPSVMLPCDSSTSRLRRFARNDRSASLGMTMGCRRPGVCLNPQPLPCSRPRVDPWGILPYPTPLPACPRMKPLALTALLVAAAGSATAQSPINYGHLTARSDSFVVMVQGNAMGFQRSTVERTESGFRLIDDVQIGPIMTQHTEVEFGHDGTLRSTKQTGQVRGQNTTIEITEKISTCRMSRSSSSEDAATIAANTTVP